MLIFGNILLFYKQFFLKKMIFHKFERFDTDYNKQDKINKIELYTIDWLQENVE